MLTVWLSINKKYNLQFCIVAWYWVHGLSVRIGWQACQHHGWKYREERDIRHTFNSFLCLITQMPFIMGLGRACYVNHAGHLLLLFRFCYSQSNLLTMKVEDFHLQYRGIWDSTYLEKHSWTCLAILLQPLHERHPYILPSCSTPTPKKTPSTYWSLFMCKILTSCCLKTI